MSGAIHKGSRELSEGTVRISIAEAHELGEAALRGLGYQPDEAKIINDQLVDNALCGYPFTGLNRILAIEEDPRTRQERSPLKVVHETPSSAVIDGGNHLGYVAVWHATKIAIAKAKQTGFAMVGVHNAYFSGRLAYFLEEVTRENLACIHLASGHPRITPYGGAGRAFGTNPLAIALPTSGDPVILDIGTALIQSGDLQMMVRINEELPEGIALDAKGNPTRSADEVHNKGGLIKAFGGHKGYGLSFMIQALGLLAGSYRMRGFTQDQGYLLIVFDPGLMVPVEEYKEQVAELVKNVKGLPVAPGFDEILVPSERSWRERRQRRAEGSIVIDQILYDELNRIVRDSKQGA